MSFTPQTTLALVTRYLESLPASQQTEQVSKATRADLTKALRMHGASAASLAWGDLLEALQLVHAQSARRQHTSPNPIVKSAFDGVLAHLTAAIEIARCYHESPRSDDETGVRPPQGAVKA